MSSYTIDEHHLEYQSKYQSKLLLEYLLEHYWVYRPAYHDNVGYSYLHCGSVYDSHPIDKSTTKLLRLEALIIAYLY